MSINYHSQPAIDLIQVFVYGTLKPGEANFDRHFDILPDLKVQGFLTTPHLRIGIVAEWG